MSKKEIFLTSLSILCIVFTIVTMAMFEANSKVGLICSLSILFVLLLANIFFLNKHENK